MERQGDSAGALVKFKFGLAKFEEINALAPDVKKFQNGRGGALLKIGDILVEQGDLQQNLEYHQRAFEIWSAVSAAEPVNMLFKRSTEFATGRITEEFEKLKDFDGALAHAQNLIAIQTEMAASDPKNVQSASELGSYYVILGSTQEKIRNFKNAQKNMRNGTEILGNLARQNPDNAGFQRDLELTYFNAGRIFDEVGSLAEAIENYRLALLTIDVDPHREKALDVLAKSFEGRADAIFYYLKRSEPDRKLICWKQDICIKRARNHGTSYNKKVN